MLKILSARLLQKHRTLRYPNGPAPELPDRFVGAPVLDRANCADNCHVCESVCPTGAFRREAETGNIHVDMGRCLFCRACEKACPAKAIRFTQSHQLAAAQRADLQVSSSNRLPPSARHELASKLFRRSLKLRQVSAGGCNACEADANVLSTPAWDMGRFGIQFVASPRHADGLLITGPVTENMRLALMKTYEAVPTPKIVIAVGACAISGGIFQGHPEAHNGTSTFLPVDLYIPGCPPHPLTILDGLLRFLGRLDEN